jgi:hypothetical protein
MPVKVPAPITNAMAARNAVMRSRVRFMTISNLVDDGQIVSPRPDTYRCFAPLALPLPSCSFAPTWVSSSSGPPRSRAARRRAATNRSSESGRLAHPGQAQLDTAVTGARRRPVGDAGLWAWDRRDGSVFVAPLVAARWPGTGRSPRGTAQEQSCGVCVKGQQLTNPETADPADTGCQGRAA